MLRIFADGSMVLSATIDNTNLDSQFAFKTGDVFKVTNSAINGYYIFTNIIVLAIQIVTTQLT